VPLNHAGFGCTSGTGVAGLEPATYGFGDRRTDVAGRRSWPIRWKPILRIAHASCWGVSESQYALASRSRWARLGGFFASSGGRVRSTNASVFRNSGPSKTAWLSHAPRHDSNVRPLPLCARCRGILTCVWVRTPPGRGRLASAKGRVARLERRLDVGERWRTRSRFLPHGAASGWASARDRATPLTFARRARTVGSPPVRRYVLTSPEVEGRLRAFRHPLFGGLLAVLKPSFRMRSNTGSGYRVAPGFDHALASMRDPCAAAQYAEAGP